MGLAPFLSEVHGEEFEPGFDPGLAVRHALAAEESPSDAAGNAVVVPCDRDVHQLPPGHRHHGGLLQDQEILNARILWLSRPVVKDYACPSVFSVFSVFLFCSSVLF